MGNDIVRHHQKWGSGLANYITVALEDRISALTTKDSAKLKVYTDHYDGHSLRAYSYFPEELPGIREYQTGKAYKITFDDGSTKLLHETEAKKHGYI